MKWDSAYGLISLLIEIHFSAVVHEATALGSDGESLEVSPCTSDQMSSSAASSSTYYQSSASAAASVAARGGGGEGSRHNTPAAVCYVPNVKMRQKEHRPNRKWSEVLPFFLVLTLREGMNLHAWISFFSIHRGNSDP